ncbi:recombinase family protein [Streptomyces sparsogenes]|uniref:recombinase family protein n=1 Tax=Streptomyces sparsogenes TaxID=67365 RepID=UPI0033F603F3
MTSPKARHQSSFTGERAAIYCRISQAHDDDQTGVDRQERICRETAERLGLDVESANVYIDNNRSAWKRNRKRPGWDQLLDAMREGEIRHVIVYHPDRLMRQPRDLEELLTIADEGQLMLHGQANRRDLSNADDRFFLRIEVAHACRSSDDTSRRLKDAMADEAAAGNPHTGRRTYGYERDGRTIIEAEAEIVREVFRRYLDGEAPRRIARTMYERGEKTAYGKNFEEGTVRRLLDNPYVAGIRIFRGEEFGIGNWPAIIDRGTWDEVKQRRELRAVQDRDTRKPKRYYLLRGVVTCTCGRRMAGSTTGSTANYRCAGNGRNDREQRCKRNISAEPLERFARDVAIEVLERLDVSGRAPAATSLPQADARANDEDAQQLKELNEMWTAKEISTPEYRGMRKAIEARIKERQRKIIQRPVAVLEGVAGPDAAANWRKLEKAEDYARINAIFRFLFAAVIIHPATSVNRFDTDRIEIESNPLD